MSAHIYLRYVVSLHHTGPHLWGLCHHLFRTTNWWLPSNIIPYRCLITRTTPTLGKTHWLQKLTAENNPVKKAHRPACDTRLLQVHVCSVCICYVFNADAGQVSELLLLHRMRTCRRNGRKNTILCLSDCTSEVKYGICSLCLSEMLVYSPFPALEDFCLVVCRVCSKVVTPQGILTHYGKRCTHRSFKAKSHTKASGRNHTLHLDTQTEHWGCLYWSRRGKTRLYSQTHEACHIHHRRAI